MSSHLPLSKTARDVLVAAREVALRMGHRFVGTEALLIAMAESKDGDAAVALQLSGISLEQICQRTELESGDVPDERALMPPFIKAAIEAGIVSVEGPGPDTGSSVDLSSRVKKVSTLAEREAKALGHRRIGTAELLLGLLREGAGVGAQVLLGMGLNLETARKAISTLEQEED